MSVFISKLLKLPKAIPEPSSHTPGQTITWDNKSWLVCHYDNTFNQVYLIASDTIDNTKFGSDSVYAISTLAARCATYQNNSMSAAALAQCVDVTAPGVGVFDDVTAKVFIPSYQQMNGGFSWFNSNTHRKVAGAAGYDKSYWTSSAGSSTYAYLVTATGSLSSIGGPTKSHGFRPCVCVQL